MDHGILWLGIRRPDRGAARIPAGIGHREQPLGSYETELSFDL